MRQELNGSPIVRLLKSYTLNTGKKIPRGQVFRRKRLEAEQMIKQGIAELYTGPFPPQKMKTNFFKSKE
jgi:hypothetical protein